ncbi:hypothetical protein ABT173_40190 [Streptomyces sp. NPDC001795]|uniref:hypothetical protein n=1 Tax=Streptomyces sp. NPDC001795 TaxID=3154525 RepID=UPI003329D8E9
MFDPRRGLRGVIPEPYRGGYAHSAALSQALATGIATELAKRLPETADPDVPRRLRQVSQGDGLPDKPSPLPNPVDHEMPLRRHRPRPQWPSPKPPSHADPCAVGLPAPQPGACIDPDVPCGAGTPDGYGPAAR